MTVPVDDRRGLLDTYLAMPAEWRRRRPRSEREFVEQQAAAIGDPLGQLVYRRLGYEPICIPRVQAALAAGHATPIEAEDAGMELPAPCGRCPAERFDREMAFEVLYGGAAGGAKELRLDEPIPTPTGWTTVGDLMPGDLIFAETGQTTTVTAVHPVDLRPVAYRLTFDDGSTIEACADHLWLTFDAAEMAALTRRDPEWRTARRVRRPSRVSGLRTPTFTAAVSDRNRRLRPPTRTAPGGTVRSTKDIVETLRTPAGRTNHAMPVASRLDLPDVDLPLNPYLLGVWLGDGTTANGEITSMDAEIWQAFADDGWSFGKPRPAGRATTRTVLGLLPALRRVGVLGDKHVPTLYLRGSAAQRLALLQGLMDTDGSCNKTGAVTFTSTRRALIDGAYELIVSLGWKARIRERRATLNGRDCGPVWSIKWTPTEHVFRLPRKADRQTFATRRTTRFRYVIDAAEVDPSPMRCITVDNPSGLYLAGRSMLVTHNTLSTLMFVVRCMHRWPGLRALFLRETFDQLDENVYPELVKYDHMSAIGGRWEAGRRQLHVGASTCRFRYLANLDDVLHRRGGSYQLIVADEANLLPPGIVDRLRDRLRSADRSIPVVGFRLTANPGGKGHGELKRQFVTPTDHGAHPDHIVRPTGAEFDRVFIASKSTDNPYLGDDYETQVLGAIEDPILRAAMRDGDWDVFVGQFFGEWSHDRHVVPRGVVQLAPSWQRIAGIDYGYAAPWCCLTGAVDGDGRLWLYRERYETQVGETDQARKIAADEKAAHDRDVTRWADPAMWAKTGQAKSVADQYQDEGVRLRQANNDRTVGWSRVRTYLAPMAACAYHRSRGWTTCPRLHVIEGTCPNLVRTLPDLPFDKNKIEDLDTDAEDHAADALRYMLIGHRDRVRRPLAGEALRETRASV